MNAPGAGGVQGKKAYLHIWLLESECSPLDFTFQTHHLDLKLNQLFIKCTASVGSYSGPSQDADPL